ncbi:FG-GAP repeat protein [Micromonospora sp. NPDC050495]
MGRQPQEYRASSYPGRGLAVGDLTGDGRPDLVLADYNSGLVVLPQV